MPVSYTHLVVDMYYLEEEAARAMDEMGIRGIAGETIMEEPTCDSPDPQKALAYARTLMEHYKDHPRIRGLSLIHI